MTPHREGIQRLPALDGLRGAAVLAVVLFHADGLLVGGYLGVDLFFVLSGFLITSNLVAEVERSGRVDLGAFWRRRARRLLPALLALMPAIAWYAARIAKPEELVDLRADALATLTYVSNWRAIFSERNYWALFAARSPLEHTWSLSIEEQYYVVWPLLFSISSVRLAMRARGLAWATGALLASSVAASLALFDREHLSRLYFGTDTRAAAILAGSLLAIAIRPRVPWGLGTTRLLDATGALTLVLLGVAWATLDGGNPALYRGGFWLTEVGYVVLITCCTQGERSFVARALATRPLMFLGTISYGVYLWHWPVACVLALTQAHLGRLAITVSYLAVTLALAVLSYRYIEEPILRRGVPLPHPALVTVGTMLVAFGAVDGATRLRLRDRSSATAATPHASVPGGDALATQVKNWDSHSFPDAARLEPGTLRMLVLGDSVAEKLGLAMRRQQDDAAAKVFVAERGVGNCSIMETFAMERFDPLAHPSPKTGCAARWVADVRELHPDVTLIVIGGGFLPTMTIARRPVSACDAPWGEAYGGRLRQLFREMGHDAGQIVLTTAAYPVGRAEEVWRHPQLLDRVDCFNALMRQTSRDTGVPLVDLGAQICPTRACTMLSDGEPIRPDGLHPDGKGADRLAQWTTDAMLQALHR